MRGHGINPAEQKYKEGDGPRFAVPAETIDRLLVFGTNGRFYTIAADRLPGGRGQGEPLRLMIDLPNEHDVISLFPHRPGMRLLIASSDGRGFIVDGEEALAQTRAGARGALLYESCVPISGEWTFGPWPDGVPVHVHGMDQDPIFALEGDLAGQSRRSKDRRRGGVRFFPADRALGRFRR